MITIGFDPILFQVGGLVIGWHGIFSALALFAGLWIGTREAEKRGVSIDQLQPLLIAAVVGGIVGARLFHVVGNWNVYAANPVSIFLIWQGGIAVYGGFIGGIVGGVIAAIVGKLPVWPLLDAAAPGILVGQAVGRLGCLANGDAWGGPCACDGAGCAQCVIYTHPNALIPDTLKNVPTHPYPAYEILGVAVVLGAAWLARGWLQTPGQRFLFCAVGYGLVRFAFSYVRQDTIIIFGLQQAQIIGVVTAFIALMLLVWRATQPAPAPPPTSEPS
ncbi:MAG: prolipoprotein diacylglyceryl transferase [Dehalococcoidia bacterium]|nr:prolipoprotein diacylglyceryl transferase [Dehalococcoidia bacterium]